MSIDIISKIQTGTPPDTNATQLFLMDVEKLLDALPQQPLFDLVVTSPPYNIGKEYVFKQIEFEYRHGIPDNDMNLLDSILYKASDEDFLRNKALLEKYVNVVYVDAASESNVPESVSAEIKERLIAYRTKTYKLNRIKAYEVFKNVSCDRIAKFAPTSLEDLKALRCLDEAQITLYGQDIIEIVSQVLNR